MKKTFIAVRDVDEETFQRFKLESARTRLKLGVALTLAMKQFLDNQKSHKSDGKKGVLGIKPVKFGHEKVNWSSEVDEILYGG